MKKKNFTLEILDAQHAHIATTDGKHKATQTAYYDGMRVMLEMILTDGHTKPGAIIRDENGRHYFIKEVKA